MGKKSKKERMAPGTAPARAMQSKESNNPVMTIRLLLSLMVLLMYGASLNFEFTLDDDLFYIKHSAVQQGLSAVKEMFSYGSLYGFDGTTGVQPYRPFTLLVFGIQKEFFNNSAAMAHLINVLLYTATVLLLFGLIQKLLPQKHLLFQAAVVFLFAVHPIHTEVVSSVKSMDELLAAVLGIAAWRCFIPFNSGVVLKWWNWVAGCILFLLALMSKESGIAFMAIIPLSLFMLTRAGWKKSLLTLILLGCMSAFFLILRHNVVGTRPASTGIPFLENVLNGAKGFSQLWATKFEILFYYIKLLFIPWPLTWDYSFNQIPLVGWDSPVALAGLLIYGGLFALALWQFRKNPLLSFSILFFFIASAPTNNLFFNNGATVGERFLFVPSLGFCLGIGWLLDKRFSLSGHDFFGSPNRLFTLLVGGLGLIFAFLSFQRSSEWKNNLTLFERGVERSPNSSRAQYSIASEYMNQARDATGPEEKKVFLDKAKAHFAKSVEIFPKNSQAHYNFGIYYTLIGDTSGAIRHYRQCVEIDNDYEEAMNNLGVLYQGRRVFDSAQYYYEMGMQADPGASKPLQNLSDLFGMKGTFLNASGDREGAILNYKKCLEYNPNNIQGLNNLASVYSGLRKYDSALICLKRAYALDTRAMMVIENIAAVSYFAGNYSQAIEYAGKALAIDNGSRKSFGVLADTYEAMGNRQEASKYRALFNRPR